MDPMTVMKTMWRHKALVLPVLLLTLLAAGYVYQFGPRSYEAKMSFAMVNPQVPTESDLLEHPELAELNSDNPYLRSSDPALISDVLITRLSDKSMAEALEDSGLSAEYNVARSANGNGFVIDLSGVSDTPAEAVATTRALGDVLVSELRTIQTVNGADDLYLFTTIAISSPDRAEEQFSSRLRSVIMVVLGGAVLMFGAVSLARSVETTARRRTKTHDDPASPGEPVRSLGGTTQTQEREQKRGEGSAGADPLPRKSRTPSARTSITKPRPPFVGPDLNHPDLDEDLLGNLGESESNPSSARDFSRR